MFMMMMKRVLLWQKRDRNGPKKERIIFRKIVLLMLRAGF